MLKSFLTKSSRAMRCCEIRGQGARPAALLAVSQGRATPGSDFAAAQRDALRFCGEALNPIIASILTLLLVGCLPDVDDECGPERPCASGQCIAGVCVPQSADMQPVDRGRPDGRLLDAQPRDGAVTPGCEATVERCNGLDDDCDERIDEGPGGVLSQPCYAADPTTRGVGQCREGRSVCRDGAFDACEDDRAPVAEFCNGLDDDCDGITDEASSVPCYGGPAETEGVGQCRAGRRGCVAAVASTECVDQVLPAAEICDGVDGDCDGVVDEGLACACDGGASRGCYAGPPATEDVGRCRGGEQTCAGQRWGACRGSILPGAEQCNGADDDCDGQVDEDLAGAPCRAGMGRCAIDGVLECTPTGLRCTAPPVRPEREVCNALDDDCDGRVDEGYNRGAACRTGIGDCAAEGFIECAADGAAICRADPLLPTPEECNATDDDCDGRIDEGATVRCYPGPAATLGIGTCRAGEQACVNGAASGQCRGAVEPVAEVCDGRDRDCDGAIDEAPARICGCMAGERRDCYAGPVGSAGRGRCAAGEQACEADGFWGPCVGEVGPSPEQCDGIDDDCDGRVDEGAADTGRACVRGVGACAVEGRRSCVDGNIACDATPGGPQDEVCNGVDDDCDGVADEGIEGVDQPCRFGQGVCETAGRTVCRAAEGVVCAGEPVPPIAEACNDLDDDCDGAIDEGVRNACGACAPRPPPDRCDGQDDDCDGRVDEAPDPLVGTHCVLGEGRCARDGRFQCGARGLRCVSDVEIGAPETCNAVDDDCDGRIDEAVACDLPFADGACVAGACAVAACAPGFVDDDGAAASGCERGCGGVEPGERLGPAEAIGIAHAADQTAIAGFSGERAWLMIDGAAPQRLAVGAAIERPRPVYDGARWRVVGRMRIDGRQRAVRLDFEAERIEVLPGLDAGTPDGRFSGASDAFAWIGSVPERQRKRLFVLVDDAAPLMIPLVGEPHPTAGPAIIGRIDGVLRVAVPVQVDGEARLRIYAIGPMGGTVDAEVAAIGPVIGRLSAARTGRTAVIVHAGDGAMRLYRVSYEAEEITLIALPSVEGAAGVEHAEVVRSPGGLMGLSVATGADPPCRLHLLRSDGRLVPGEHAAPACVAMSITSAPDGPLLAWIDAVGEAHSGLTNCR